MIDWLARVGALARNKKMVDGVIAAVAALMMAAIAMIAVDEISFLTSADRFVQDWEIATRTPFEPQDKNITIVAIDESVMQHFPYRSPMDHGFLARLLLALDAKHPKVIVLDYLLDQKTEPDKDSALYAAMRSIKTPLVVSYYEAGGAAEDAQGAFLRNFVPARARASANIGTDQTDTVRWILPGLKIRNGGYLPSVPRRVAQLAGVDTPAERTPIVWRADPGVNQPAFSEITACAGDACIPTPIFLKPQMFKDRIVLIGSDQTLVDQHRTPFATDPGSSKALMPGIKTFAYAIAQLLEHRDPPQLEWWNNFFIALAFAAIGAVLGLGGQSLWLRGGAVVLLIAVLWSVGVLVLYERLGILIGLVAPTLSLFFAFALVDSITGLAARRQRHFIQNTLSLYVPPSFVQQLEDHPEMLVLGGERRELGLLFTDIHGFTTMAEQLDSRDVGRVLNSYLDGMTAAIQKNEGTIDKFIGDAVFALWNAPLDVEDYATKSVLCALEMDRFTEQFRKQMNAEGIPLSYTRIGVHAGAAAVGNFGSRHRFSYTASGDAVNAASRLEGLNKTFGTRLCVSDATRVLCRGIEFRPIGSVILKGKTEALDVWEPLHEGAHDADYLARYTAAFEAARDHKPEALTQFEALATAAPDDPLVRFYVERLAQGETGVKIKMIEK
jgi:class 3 adenylate cyclase/CHASE2 domain-containing sensor protein